MAEKKEKTKAKTPSRSSKKALEAMPIQRENYLFIGIGLIGIVIGYLLMLIDSDVDGFLSLTLSPIILVASYVWIAFALLYKKGKSKAETA